MSLYNLVHGENPWADIVLGALDLAREDVGRFRDAFVSAGESGPEVAVYTRNGGGNRSCVHDDGEGISTCKGTPRQVEEDEYTTTGVFRKTGRRITVTRYTCDAPDSASCGCHGCVITHRLPQHPDYLRDADDEFDCTYATVYFKIPEQHRALLEPLALNRFDPDARWQAALDAVKNGKAPHVAARLQPLVDQIAAALKG